jgi:ABC-type amino acid transport substrate-binding protein
MSLFNYFPVFLLAAILQFGCDDDNTKSNPESALANKVSSEDQDSTDQLYINIKGDSVSYHHWTVDDEILGLANIAFGDLDSMIARRYIRVLVPYSKTYYYTEGMKRFGLAYDLLNLFEKDLNKQLKLNPSTVRVIFIPVSREHIIPLLKSGRADMIASGYTITNERKKEIDFSLPTVTGIKDVLVSGPSASPINSIEDLAGKHVFVRENSSYQSSLVRLNQSFEKKGLQPVHI